MAVMELVALLEEEFGASVGDDEITEENFGSVAAIARFVTAQRRRDPAAAPAR
jgi:acyl carrier protein